MLLDLIMECFHHRLLLMVNVWARKVVRLKIIIYIVFIIKDIVCFFLINEDFSLSYVKEFKLASYKSGNHMNGVQFYPNSDILYSSEFYERNFNVEKVILSEGKSEYLQKIVIEDTGFLENCKLNIICGDDGFLWVFGAPGDALGKMHFVKFRCPDLSLKEVTIGRNEVLEHWMIVDDIFMQGGKIKNGYLYFVSGSAYYKKRLMVFNIHTKTLYRDILLNDIITEEPEDCDIINNKLIITVCGGTSYYVIDL